MQTAPPLTAGSHSHFQNSNLQYNLHIKPFAATLQDIGPGQTGDQWAFLAIELGSNINLIQGKVFSIELAEDLFFINGESARREWSQGVAKVEFLNTSDVNRGIFCVLLCSV